ncbi:MAG: PilX N-terminal domain-containing pilus assembly protein [Gammaproteobacteria bacterium]|nr:PilX N-terminal domain-containing pilus assembly protein [Gammaproteobacteria bacterium]
MHPTTDNKSLTVFAGKTPLAKVQAGASLIISLMLLVVLTLLGLSGMQSTIMQERMSSNSRDTMLAFQAAESAVREGESWINSQIQAPGTVNSCASAPCDIFKLNATDLTNMTDKSLSWWQSNGRNYSSTLNGLAASPRFIVEQNSTSRGSLVMGTGQSRSQRVIYRVTAQGIGGTDTAQSIIETMYAERFYGSQ